MRLYDAKMAPNPRRVRMFLAEKGIEVETVGVDIMKFETQTPEFTAKNERQRLPVLELDDGTCIAESVAICRYFEEMQPEPPLMGRDAKDRAVVEMWNRRIEHGLFAAVASAFRHTNANMAGHEVPQISAWGEANKAKAEEEFRALDARLQDSTHIAGDDFTIADITAVCAVDFARIIGRRVGEDTPHLQRWHAALAARPSYKA